MATIKTANTANLAQNLFNLYQEAAGEVRWVAQKAFYTVEKVRDGGPSSFVDAVMARAYASSGWGGDVHQYTFFGQQQNDRARAAATTWEIDFEADNEVEAGVARIGTFNVWQDQVLQLNGYTSTFRAKEKEGSYSSNQSYKSAFTSDAAFTATYGQPSYDYFGDDYEVHGHVNVQASATSRLFSASREGSEQVRDGSASRSETYSYELQSKAGLGFSEGSLGGTLDSLRYVSKGTLAEKGVKLAWDEAYQFDKPLHGIGQLLAAVAQNTPGALEQLNQLLLSGDDTITLTGKLGGELRGGAGNDTLIGGKGNDRLSGDAGADTLKGGAGKDVFSFATGDSSLAAPDVVLDFKTRQDKLHIQIDASASDVLLLTAKQVSLAALLERAGDAFTQGSQVVFGSDGRKGYVVVDSDGDRQADMLIELAGITSASKVAVGDFLFG